MVDGLSGQVSRKFALHTAKGHTESSTSPHWASVYVLHAFHKKAKHGIATPKQELDLARRRYRELVGPLRSS
jgi:hypothetical protein